jgi:hypothetical protein
LIVGVGNIPFVYIFAVMLGEASDAAVVFYSTTSTLLLTLVVLLPWILRGKSIGDGAMSIQFVDNESSKKAASCKYLFKFVFSIVISALPFIGLIYYIVDLVVFLSSENRRTLTDRITGLKAIKV